MEQNNRLLGKERWMERAEEEKGGNYI